MKTILLVFLSFFYLSTYGQQWQLSGQSTFFPSSDLMASRFYVSVLDNNGFAVTGLKASNFIAYGETCDPKNQDFCSFVELQNALPPLEIEPGLYNIIFRTKSTPPTVIKTVFLKVFTIVSQPNRLPKFIQHGQVILKTFN